MSVCPVCKHDITFDERSQLHHVGGVQCPCPCDGSYADPHRHPTGDHYAPTADGNVRVQSLATGRTGVFSADGTWLEGDLRCADPHMVTFATSLPIEGQE